LLTIRLTQALGNVLKKLNMFEAARNCYKTIQDAGAILDLYEAEAKSLK
jgi:hypothetical protein